MTENTVKAGFTERIKNGMKNSISAILHGEFLLRLNISRYFMHILYTFVLFTAVIWISLTIDTTLSKVEKNQAKLKELETIHSMKTSEVVSLSRRSSVEQQLASLGSTVAEADKPATVLMK